jgi:hypothetical protein
MNKSDIKERLLSAGIKNLEAFGYNGENQVTKENILTDIVYSGFFEVMLEDNLGNGSAIDEAIHELLKEIRTYRGQTK